MASKPFRLNTVLQAHDWPLQAVRGAFAEALNPNKSQQIDFSTLHRQFVVDPETYVEQTVRTALHNESAPKSEESANKANSQAFDALIAATYHEGVELYRVLGEHFLDAKLAHYDPLRVEQLTRQFQKISAEQADDEHEKIARAAVELAGENSKQREMPKSYSRNNEFLAGCLHVLELIEVGRTQAKADLLREEGILPDAQYQKGVESIYHQLAAQGHAGIYRMAIAHPEIDAFLKADKRHIVVEHSRGKQVHSDVAGISQFTRSAYLNAEQGYLDATKWQDQKKYLEEYTYPQSMGKWYRAATEVKAEAARKAAHVFTEGKHDIMLDTLSALPPVQSTESAEYDHFKRQSKRYVAKHGLALMHPEIVELLEEHGKLTPENIGAINHAFHYGFTTPYLPHINEMHMRVRSKCDDAQGQRKASEPLVTEGAEPKTLPTPNSKSNEPTVTENTVLNSSEEEAQKKTPGLEKHKTSEVDRDQKKRKEEDEPRIPREDQDSPDPKQNPTNNDGTSSGKSSSTDSGNDDAGKKEASKQKNIATGIKVGSAVLGSILVADQLHRANKNGSNAIKRSGENQDASDSSKKSEKSSKIANYVIATIAAAGVAVVVFTKPEKLVQFVSSIAEFFKGGGKGNP